VGPVDLTQGTVSNTRDVPTVTDNLYAQGTIASNSIGVFYEPSSSANVSNGEITFGGTDHTKLDGIFLLIPTSSDILHQVHWRNQLCSYYNHLSCLEGKSSSNYVWTCFLKLTIIKYWGINQSISYGTGNTILRTTAGIVDTGTTLLLLATGMYTYLIDI
jgi:hypothetical protein